MPEKVVMEQLAIIKEAIGQIEASYGGGGEMEGEYEEDGGMDYNEGSSHKMPPARGRRGKMNKVREKGPDYKEM